MDNIIYIKKENDKYTLTYKNFKTECFIGKNGLTTNKIEGDLKTPIGRFKLGIAFGIHNRDTISIDKSFRYKKINKNLYWVDDTNSIYYNQLVDITKIKKDFTTAESLLDNKIPYEYAIEIKSNPNNIPRKGSAIFLHCAKNNYTAGCVAISKEDMIKLLKLINQNTEIIIENSQ